LILYGLHFAAVFTVNHLLNTAVRYDDSLLF